MWKIMCFPIGGEHKDHKNVVLHAETVDIGNI